MGDLLLVGLALLFLFGGKGAGPKAEPDARDPWTAPVEPSPGADFDVVLCECNAAWKGDAAATVAELTMCALERLVPGVPWPAQDADHKSLRELQQLVEDRARELVAARDAGTLEAFCTFGEPPPADLQPAPAEPPASLEPLPAEPPASLEPFNPVLTPQDLLSPFVASSAKGAASLAGGRFVKAYGNPTQMAREALGVNAGHPAIVPYLLAFTKAPWNWKTLVSRWDGKSPNEAYTLVADDGQRYHVWKGWLAMHADNVQRIYQGQQPIRTISLETGKQIASGNSYADVYLPEAYIDDAGELVIVSLVPPPEVQALTPGVYA